MSAGVRLNLAGKKFGRLLAIELCHKNGPSYYKCICECGNEIIVRGPDLKNGHSQSCGCLSRERVKAATTTHGKSGTDEHRAWKEMRRRCLDPKRPAYAHYGGRGITICKRWNNFANFLEDMGLKPGKNHSIERINNNGNYEPGNCKWGTHFDQANNKRNSRFITYGDKTMTVEEWNYYLKLPPARLRSRLWRGWSVKRAIETK